MNSIPKIASYMKPTLADEFSAVPEPVGITDQVTVSGGLDVVRETIILYAVIGLGHHIGIVRHRLIAWNWKTKINCASIKVYKESYYICQFLAVSNA